MIPQYMDSIRRRETWLAILGGVLAALSMPGFGAVPLVMATGAGALSRQSIGAVVFFGVTMRARNSIRSSTTLTVPIRASVFVGFWAGSSPREPVKAEKMVDLPDCGRPVMPSFMRPSILLEGVDISPGSPRVFRHVCGKRHGHVSSAFLENQWTGFHRFLNCQQKNITRLLLT